MKKVLAVLAVVAVVFVAGSALAQPRARDNVRRMPPQAMQDMQRPHVDQRNNPQFEGDPRYVMRGPAEKHPEAFEGRGRCSRGMRGNRGGRDGRLDFAPDMPEEIRAKAVEAAKLRIDLDALLAAKPIDKAKALEVFAQVQKAEQEVKAWRFAKKLDRIEDFRKQQELNSKNLNAPAPAAPAEKAE